MLEKLGIRFRNHGDVIPRAGRGESVVALLARLHADLKPQQQEWSAPIMALRGSQPFFDFPAGPDWWGVEGAQSDVN
eukprot:SAG31_NODE_1008_length_10407_cov_2.369131_1_plen_77_part_00